MFVLGDLMGTSANNLESLIRMPHGCGEQNMITFAPLVYVVRYLNRTHQLSNQMKAKALKYIQAGEFCLHPI